MISSNKLKENQDHEIPQYNDMEDFFTSQRMNNICKVELAGSENSFPFQNVVFQVNNSLNIISEKKTHPIFIIL